jgi:hypothetical protein
MGAVVLLAALLLAASSGWHSPQPHRPDLWRRTVDGWERVSTWPQRGPIPPPAVPAPLWAAMQLLGCLAALRCGVPRSATACSAGGRPGAIAENGSSA